MAMRVPGVRALLAGGTLGLVVSTACGDGATSPHPVPTTVSIAPSAVTLSALGATQQLTATVRDQSGAVMTGVTVTWSSSNTSVAPVTAAGLVTAATNGTADVTATAGSVSARVTVTVSAPPPAGTVEIAAGNNQVALAAYPVNVPPAVRLRDTAGNPVPGATVNFAVLTGGGSVTGASALTDANGIAEVGSWTVGQGANSLSATVVGSDIANNPVTVSATGATQQYNIVLRYITSPAVAHQAAFTAARTKWELLVFGDVPSVQLVTHPGQSCGGVTIADSLNESIDDLVIYVDLEPIDGQGGVIGSAGPCYIRSNSRLPLLGGMKFDTDDLDYLNNRGLLDETIFHEMGHVIGFGTLWGDQVIDLLRDPSDTAEGGTLGADTYFAGTRARWAFDRIGGATYVGAKVPVENDNANYGSGSLDSHWRESVFETELMTPTLNGGGGIDNLISSVTAASMGDLGYTVNYGAADDYALPGPAAVAAAELLPAVNLGDDVARGPIYLVDRGGRVVGVIRQ